MGRLVAAAVAANDEGQVPFVESPQRLLGELKLLALLHVYLLSRHRGDNANARFGG